MKTLITSILMLVLLTSNLVYGQTPTNDSDKSLSESNVQETPLRSRCLVIGSNLNLLSYNEKFDSYNTNQSGLGINVNVGYTILNTTQIGLQIENTSSKYTSDNYSDETQRNLSYGLFITQYLINQRLSPFIKLSGNLVQIENYSVYNGWNVGLQAGVCYRAVKQLYLQTSMNFLTYQNVESNDSKISSTLLGLNQPFNVGFQYWFNLKQ